MKFKVGDKVKVIAKKHGHGFNIGEIVKIETINVVHLKKTNYGGWEKMNLQK